MADTTSLEVPTLDILFTFIVMGSFHQGDMQFSEYTAGRQCSCNAVIALIFINIYEVITTSHIDRILQEGDKLYTI